jgi:hypothetical protein
MYSQGLVTLTTQGDDEVHRRGGVKGRIDKVHPERFKLLRGNTVLTS